MNIESLLKKQLIICKTFKDGNDYEVKCLEALCEYATDKITSSQFELKIKGLDGSKVSSLNLIQTSLKLNFLRAEHDGKINFLNITDTRDFYYSINKEKQKIINKVDSYYSLIEENISIKVDIIDKFDKLFSDSIPSFNSTTDDLFDSFNGFLAQTQLNSLQDFIKSGNLSDEAISKFKEELVHDFKNLSYTELSKVNSFPSSQKQIDNVCNYGNLIGSFLGSFDDTKLNNIGKEICKLANYGFQAASIMNLAANGLMSPPLAFANLSSIAIALLADAPSPESTMFDALNQIQGTIIRSSQLILERIDLLHSKVDKLFQLSVTNYYKLAEIHDDVTSIKIEIRKLKTVIDNSSQKIIDEINELQDAEYEKLFSATLNWKKYASDHIAQKTLTQLNTTIAPHLAQYISIAKRAEKRKLSDNSINELFSELNSIDLVSSLAVVNSLMSQVIGLEWTGSLSIKNLSTLLYIYNDILDFLEDWPELQSSQNALDWLKRVNSIAESTIIETKCLNLFLNEKAIDNLKLICDKSFENLIKGYESFLNRFCESLNSKGNLDLSVNFDKPNGYKDKFGLDLYLLCFDAAVFTKLKLKINYFRLDEFIDLIPEIEDLFLPELKSLYVNRIYDFSIEYRNVEWHEGGYNIHDHRLIITAVNIENKNKSTLYEFGELVKQRGTEHIFVSLDLPRIEKIKKCYEYCRNLIKKGNQQNDSLLLFLKENEKTIKGFYSEVSAIALIKTQRADEQGNSSDMFFDNSINYFNLFINYLSLGNAKALREDSDLNKRLFDIESPAALYLMPARSIFDTHSQQELENKYTIWKNDFFNDFLQKQKLNEAFKYDNPFSLVEKIKDRAETIILHPGKIKSDDRKYWELKNLI